MIIRIVLLLLIPGILYAEERRTLNGKVISVREHEEPYAEANLTVTIQETNQSDVTNSVGIFRIFLPDIFKSGEKTTIIVNKEGWRIQYPLDGEARIPADLKKDLIEVRLLRVGSKLFWSNDRIEKFINDLADKSRQQVTLDGKPEKIDFSRYIKEWALQYGFSAHDAKQEINKWVKEVEERENDLHKLGLAAFAKKNFSKAGRLFRESADLKAKRLQETVKTRKALEEKERVLSEEVVRDYRLEGDAYYSNYQFKNALMAYEKAMNYVPREQSPQLWASILTDISKTHWEIGIRVKGIAIEKHLNAAVKTCEQALEVYTRAELPQDWAMTQNNLGAALSDQGIRTGGKEGVQLLADAVTAYRKALEVRTREELPQDWAGTQNNLAQAYLYLEDWQSSAACYSHVLTVYPDDIGAYQGLTSLFHEKLFKFSEAFELNQNWLKLHPEDVSALVDFAEKHFTTGRFVECEKRCKSLLASTDVSARDSIILTVIEIANLRAINNPELIPSKLDTLIETIASQNENFVIEWSFEGTKYFISNSEKLKASREWLLQFINAIERENRGAILKDLKAIRANFHKIDKDSSK